MLKYPAPDDLSMAAVSGRQTAADQRQAKRRLVLPPEAGSNMYAQINLISL